MVILLFINQTRLTKDRIIMCLDCGCGKTEEHSHPDGHTHGHDHTAGHVHVHKETITLEQKILSENDRYAAQNRKWLADRGVTAINIISSPGSGKTYLLEKTLERLAGRIGCAVITGDLQTDNDARRLLAKCDNVKQIQTVSACHLDAHMIGHTLEEVIKPGIKLLFIENVGNLVCPAVFDVGENFKIALISVTEGEDKPEKYPVIFSTAEIVVLTKTDLIPHTDFDRARFAQALKKVHPGVFVFELSAKTGEGMDAWINYLTAL